jgi:RNA polymerase sigma-70 factor (ECF subfamily)
MKSPEFALPQTNQDDAPDDELRDPGYFARFFRAEAPRLRAYLCRFMNRADAEELAQEAFIRVFSAPGEVRSPSRLLFRIARNLAIDRGRHMKRGWFFVDADEGAVATTVPDLHASPEEALDWRQQLQGAAVVLDLMPPRCREIFLLQVVDGHTYAEIAARLGISVVIVKKDLLRAFNICTTHALTDKHQVGRRGLRPKRERKAK